MANPNTHREALIAELLGDVGDLLDRTEELKASFPVAGEAAAGKVRVAGEMATGGVTAAGERFLSVFDEKKGPLGPARRPGSRRRGAGGRSGG